MSAIRVKAQVPEDRVVTLKVTLPDDVPVGEVELDVSVHEPEQVYDVVLPPDNRPRVFPSRPTHPKMAAEFDAFEKMLPDLMAQFAGRYIVLHHAKVIAVADSEVEALTAARAAFPAVLGYVRRVTDQPQPIERLPSVRLVETR
jgi:hypothetical protein